MSEDNQSDRLRASEDADLLRWVELINRRNGYSGMFARRTAEDKAIVEYSVMQSWIEAMRGAFGIEVCDAQPNPQDPPDFLARVGGRSLEIELVELIDNQQINRVMRNNETPYHGQLFVDSQWTAQRLQQALSGVIEKKADNYSRRHIQVDALLIYTGEPWLEPAMVKQWLPKLALGPHSSVRSAFLMLEYSPGYATHWPLFLVYGELGM